MNQQLKMLIKKALPFWKQFLLFSKTQQQASYLTFIKFKLGLIPQYWPKDARCTIANPKRIKVGINALIGRPGVYIQGAGNVIIGNYVQFGPNVGILSSNHDLYNQTISHSEPINIGDYTWVGMNSVILAGVTLGPRTIVAAGAIVTKSFPEGFCVIAGNPAKIIKTLDKSIFEPWSYGEEFYGFIPAKDFDKVKNKYIDI